MMENVKLYSDRNMIDYAKTVADFRLPRWEQIPALGLYMDQVITVIDQALSPLIGFGEEATITPSMINNYVKLGIDTALKNGDTQSSYDSFCDYVERSVKIVAKSAVNGDETVRLYFDFNSEHALITMAVCSFATKIVTAKMVSVIRENNRELTVKNETEIPK